MWFCRGNEPHFYHHTMPVTLLFRADLQNPYLFSQGWPCLSAPPVHPPSPKPHLPFVELGVHGETGQPLPKGTGRSDGNVFSTHPSQQGTEYATSDCIPLPNPLRTVTVRQWLFPGLSCLIFRWRWSKALPAPSHCILWIHPDLRG